MKQAGAFFLAPVPAAIFGGTVSWLSGGWPRPLSLILFYLLLLYAAQIAFGLAIRALLLRVGKVSATSFGLGGVAMIALPAVPFLIWAVWHRPDRLGSAPIVLAVWLACGGMTGLGYWLLTRPKAPLTRPSL